VRRDAVVVGGGVVGLAVAMRLARDGRAVVVLERHPSFGREASSRNSEVVHAGMYYATGSLKARLCVAGNRSLFAWCTSHQVEARRIGKFIVATADDEIPALERIHARAESNGVAALRWAEPGELAAAEPHVRAVAALFSPDTGIVDSHGLMQSLADAAGTSDAVLAWGHEFTGAERVGSGYRVAYRDPAGDAGTIEAALVVNAGGLEADLIAAGMGLDIDALQYRVRYVKGSYFRVSEAWRGRLRHLVYPVPHPGLTGLGSHVTLDLAGGVRLGPDVEFLAGRRIDYSVDPARADDFAAAAGRYLPELTVGELRPDLAGIRARRVLADPTVSPDFVIAEESAHGLPGWVYLIGIESPGLTCCLEIADPVATLLPG
jgi:L-2-hydroxyglutarate oxidase LhgO